MSEATPKQIEPRTLAPGETLQEAPLPAGSTAVPGERVAVPIAEPLPAPPSFPIVCSVCKHAATGPHDPATSILVCDQCGARVAYGVAMPRVVVGVERPFVTLKIGAGEVIKLDPQYAKSLAMNILSVI